MGKLIDVYCDDRGDMYEDLFNKIFLCFYNVIATTKRKKIFFFKYSSQTYQRSFLNTELIPYLNYNYVLLLRQQQIKTKFHILKRYLNFLS